MKNVTNVFPINNKWKEEKKSFKEYNGRGEELDSIIDMCSTKTNYNIQPKHKTQKHKE